MSKGKKTKFWVRVLMLFFSLMFFFLGFEIIYLKLIENEIFNFILAAVSVLMGIALLSATLFPNIEK